MFLRALLLTGDKAGRCKNVKGGNLGKDVYRRPHRLYPAVPTTKGGSFSIRRIFLNSKILAVPKCHATLLLTP
jgi:hypothetical protein